jgi:hypothetical protein
MRLLVWAGALLALLLFMAFTGLASPGADRSPVLRLRSFASRAAPVLRQVLVVTLVLLLALGFFMTFGNPAASSSSGGAVMALAIMSLLAATVLPLKMGLMLLAVFGGLLAAPTTRLRSYNRTCSSPSLSENRTHTTSTGSERRPNSAIIAIRDALANLVDFVHGMRSSPAFAGPLLR